MQHDLVVMREPVVDLVVAERGPAPQQIALLERVAELARVASKHGPNEPFELVGITLVEVFD